MTEFPPIAAVYLATVVTADEGGQQIPIERSALLRSAPGALHVITAWNPGDLRPGRDKNDAANGFLREELAARGCVIAPARGADPGSDHFEESFAVIGLSDAEACEIGARFGQVAVFRIEAGHQTVLSCTEDWTVSRPLG